MFMRVFKQLISEELLHGVGAAKLVDKMDLYDQLIPAIPEFAPA